MSFVAGLSALLNPTLASAAATLTTALAAASNAVSNAGIPPPGLAIPTLGASALPLVANVVSPARLSSTFFLIYFEAVLFNNILIDLIR